MIHGNIPDVILEQEDTFEAANGHVPYGVDHVELEGRCLRGRRSGYGSSCQRRSWKGDVQINGIIMVAKYAACVRHFRVNVKSVSWCSGRWLLYVRCIVCCVCLVNEL